MINDLFLTFLLFLFCSNNILNCEVIQLDETNQQYNENVLITSVNQDSGLGFEYGMWTRYQPLANIKQIGDIIPTSTDCSLFHYITNSNMEQLIYYLCFNNELKKIEHSVQLISYNQLRFTQTLVIENDYHYEGRWFYYHLACIPNQDKFIIFIGTLDQINVSFKEYYDYLPFQDDQLTFYYGNCREVINDQFKPLTLASFRGSIIVNTMSYDLIRDSIHFTLEEIYQLWQDEEDNYTFYEYSPYLYYDSELEITQEDEKQSNQNFLFDCFSLFGWFKVEGELLNGNDQEFIKLKSTTIYKEYQQEFAYAQTTLSYQQPNINTDQILLSTYSYSFPNINIFKTTMTKISQPFTLENSFNKWHFIFLKFINDQLTLIIYQNNQELSATFNLRQFTGYPFKLLLGSQFANTNTKLYAYNFQTMFYKPGVLNSNFQIICNPSCLTCSGPTEYDCESCFTTDCEYCNITDCPSACRTYEPISKSCVCHIGYYDYLKYECLGISSQDYTLQINNSTIQYNNCDPNYYKLNGECVKCPEIRNEYVQSCYSCKNDWNFICWQQLISLEGDPNNVYSLKYGENSYLYTYDESLQCEFCSISNYGSQVYKYQHLDQPIYVYCRSDYIYFNKECILSVRIMETFDFEDSSDSSPDCNDPSQAYLSFFDKNQCLPCLIENCKYCFDYSLSDYLINTYQQNLNEMNYDDIITGCALCFRGYVYNQKTNACETHDQPEYCKTAILNKNEEIVCLISYVREKEAISYTECQDLIDNCQECMIISEGNICTLCQVGYFYNFFQGID